MNKTRPTSFCRGRYRVLDVLGQGSMGIVYRCEMSDLQGEIVALKILLPDALQNKKAVLRFKNEMTACYRIDHPNVVRPLEVIKDSEVLGLSMEFVDGGNLAEYMLEHPRLELSEITQKLLQLCTALEAVHRADVLHRDIKPENVLISSSGNPKLADFGTALLADGPRVTERGSVVGSVPYVSPEYIEYQTLDSRSDVYALGVLGYEMITGSVPFLGETVMDTVNRKLFLQPPPPLETRLDCTPSLSDAILRAIERNPQERFQTASEFRSALEEVLRELRTQDRSDPRSGRIHTFSRNSGR